LGLVVAFSVALSAWQLWVPNTHAHESHFSSLPNRAEVLRRPWTLLPPTWYAGTDYADRSLPFIATPAQFTFAPAHVEDNRLVASVSFPAGLQPFATNIVGGPYLVHVGGGVRVVGRTEEGYLVLERTSNGSQPVPVELRAQRSATVLLGRITTALSAALLVALTLAAVVRRRRRRR
jgi:hypothetical protein